PPSTPNMAANLPIELIYCILDYLDVEDYLAVWATCRKWRAAASSSSLIRNTLQQVPILLPSRTELLTRKEWNIYFEQVVRQNLLSYRKPIRATVSRYELPHGCSHCTIYDTSRDGTKLVVMKGAQALLYGRQDIDSSWELIRSLPLYGLWTSVCPAILGGMTGDMSQHAHHRIALSPDGQFLAVGMVSTVQIYSLLGDLAGLTAPAQYTLNEDNQYLHPPPANYEETNGLIESLEFADDEDGTLLRVVIGQDTTTYGPTRVRYLGNPAHKPTGAACSFAYWRDNINQIYLDSASMAATLSVDNGDKIFLQGLRLLPRSYRPSTTNNDDPTQPARRHFTACLQTGTTSTSGYCIGQLVIHTPSTTTSTPPPTSITRLLPSRHNHIPDLNIETPPTSPPRPTFQSIDTHHKLTTLHAATTARWNTANLPIAPAASSTSAPLIAISPDATLMCIYEPGTGHYSPIAQGGAVYVYSL
ncbi:F-box protein, partial [Aspergillus saccharolyticus JOP 1030-1]